MNSPWTGHPNEVSVHTYIRNQIHHSAENGRPEPTVLKASILTLRSYL
jgi:hypothetical protein